MKKIIYLIILVTFCSAFRGYSQNYYMNSVNNTTITTCRGNVMPSWLCTAFGYSGYCNNENYKVTFYSGNPLIPMRISFLSLALVGFPTTDAFYTESGFDFLKIYDGPNTGSPLLANLTGNIVNTFSYTSTGPYLTIQFTSDVTVNDWGWFAIIGCQPQGCGGNLPASDNCAGATALCDLNGYCGATNGWYTPDNTNLAVNQGGPFCGASGSIENNAWVKFIPSAANATININVANCTSATQGLQAGLYATNCSTFNLLTCQSQATYAPVMSLTYGAFVPGQVYYLMIDGYAGNACDYTVNASGGVAVSSISATSGTICAGSTTTLTAVAAGSGPTYTWSTGPNTSTIAVSPTLTTVYSASVVSGFCNEVVTRTITVNPRPTANAGPSPASITCSNPTQVLSGSGGGSYTWSGTGIVSGGASASPTVNAGGPFSLTVTSAAGCTSTNVATVSVPINTTAPTAGITVPGVLNCSSPTMTLTGSPAAGVTYNWTGPSGFTSTSANPAVTLPGTYNLTVTSTVNGCPSTPTNASVTQNTTQPAATASTSGAVTCLTNTISLTSTPAGLNYTWTAPGGSSISSGVNSQNATGAGVGVYTVTIKDPANGCSKTATVAAAINNAPPAATASTVGIISCTNNTITLNGGPAGMNYTWTAPGGSSISSGVNSQSAVGQGPGTYTITVVNPANSCSNTAQVTASVNMTPPAETASSSGVINCTNTAISLSVTPAASSYTWTAGGGGSITGGTNSQNATGSGNGTYSVTLTTSNGCTVTATTTPSVNMAPPTETATATGVITCNSNTLNLTVNPAAASYTWSAGGGGSITGGVNSQNTTASGNTTYSVIIKTSNNCTVMATVSPSVNTAPPTGTASVASGVITCASNTLNLTVNPGGNTYLWSAGGGGTITSGGASQNATAAGNGTYSVVITGAVNGCTLMSTVSPSVNTTVITPTITPASVLNCTQTTVPLNGSPGAGVTYTWSAPSGTNIVAGGSAATATVNGPGIYTLAITNTVNGCLGTQTVSVTQSLTTPTVSAATQTANLICGAASVVLSGSSSPVGTPTWSSSGGGFASGINNYTVAATTATVYMLSVAHPTTGCISSLSYTVIPDVNSPTVTLSSSNATITCLTTAATTTATSNPTGVTYSWSGPGIMGASNTSVVTGSVAGTYSAVVTNTANSCQSTVAFVITPNNAPVTPTATSSNTITCNTTTTSITAGSGAGTYTYTWSGPSSFTSTAQTFTTSVGGTYTAMVTNTSSGCTGSITVSAVTNTAVPTAVSISPNTFTLPCSPPTATLVASATGAASYSWSTSGGSILSGAATATAGISGPGTYSVIATAANGCSAPSATAAISQSTASPILSPSSTSPSITCSSSTATITVVVTSTVAPISSIVWTPTTGIIGSTTSNTVAFNAPGVYTGVFTATNGCTSNAVITVGTATTAPTMVAGTGTAAAITCTNSTVTIAPTFTPAGAYTYSWTGPGVVGTPTNSSVMVNLNGTYSLTVVDPLTGCSTTSITIPVFGTSIPPTLTVTSSSSIGIGCTPSTSTISLTANSTPPTGINYLWSTSATTSVISTSAPGVYSVTATDPSSGCSQTETISIANNATAPTINAGSNVALPCGGTSTIALSGSSTTTGVTYSWTGPGIVSGANTSSPSVNMAGQYSLTVTDPVNGCNATSTVNVSSTAVVASFTPDVTSGVSPLTVNFTNTSSGATTFNWTFGNAGTSSSFSPSQIFTGNGTFAVVLIASSGACSDTASIDIIVSDGLSLEIPNVFTPNNDGVNDVFTVTSKGVKSITLEVYNRWGQKMYEFTGAKAAWDGMTSSGNEATAGTYFYFVKATGFDDKEITKNGSLSLFR